jgi:hypothetical protein
MTDLRHCSIHGRFRADYPDPCPECSHEQWTRDYTRDNPGEYKCPNCLYITLRSGAMRCPKCQGSVDAGYWNRVEANAKAAEERLRIKEAEAKAEWQRSAPAREAAAREAAERAEQQRAERDEENLGKAIGSATLGGLGGLAVGFGLGMAAALIVGLVSCLSGGRGSETTGNTVGTAIFILSGVIGAIVGFVMKRDRT